MPKTKILFYKEENDFVPVLYWLTHLPSKAAAKCFVKIERLAELGHELRCPEADLLKDKIYELRIDLQGIHYRILYFYNGIATAVLAHAITKEKAVPLKEINTVLTRKNKFELNPSKHTYER